MRKYLTKEELQKLKDKADAEESLRMQIEPHPRAHYAKVKDYSIQGKVQRNDMCLCKSGKKYKHCCWKYLN